jgi:hypothetical protein
MNNNQTDFRLNQIVKIDNDIVGEIICIANADENYNCTEIFVCYNQTDCGGVHITKSVVDYWTKKYSQSLSDYSKYYNKYGSWIGFSRLKLLNNAGTNVQLSSSKREENPCQVCKRMNDVGVKTCWNCGNKPF